MLGQTVPRVKEILQLSEEAEDGSHITWEVEHVPFIFAIASFWGLSTYLINQYSTLGRTPLVVCLWVHLVAS